jgi:hypothetical protein
VVTAEIITEPLVLEQFRQRYAALARASIDMEYLCRNTVRGFFSDSGELLGGYVYCASTPFRYVSAVPFSVAELLGEDRVDDVCECTCIWMERSLSSTERIGIYAWAYRDFSATGKRHVLGGSFNEKVMRIQRHGLPELVFAGQATVEGKTVRAWVYVGTRWTCVRALLIRSPVRLWLGLMRWAQSSVHAVSSKSCTPATATTSSSGESETMARSARK